MENGELFCESMENPKDSEVWSYYCFIWKTFNKKRFRTPGFITYMWLGVSVLAHRFEVTL